MLANNVPGLPLTQLKSPLGSISSLRGVQLLIVAWWSCAAAFQPGAVASEAKQKFLSYYFVLPEGNLKMFLIK